MSLVSLSFPALVEFLNLLHLSYAADGSVGGMFVRIEE
jgi:hypothetical protein